jgi:hypothetical protein
MSRDQTIDDALLADDLLWGVNGQNGIAAFLGIKRRQAYHLNQVRRAARYEAWSSNHNGEAQRAPTSLYVTAN